MPIRCGIVGLPNVGKSTLFNALTRAQVPAENYPFCTIDPNVGVVPVPDPRLAQLAAIARPEKIVPTTVEFVDIAGLVAGASQGEGLGNQFLSHIREVDAIAHVVRCFESGDVIHVAGRIDPLSDVEIIDTELALADLATLEKGLDRATRAAKSGDQDAIRRRALFERAKAQLDAVKPARALALTEEERRDLRELQLLTAKPVMYVANVAENGFHNNPFLAALEHRAAGGGGNPYRLRARLHPRRSHRLPGLPRRQGRSRCARGRQAAPGGQGIPGAGRRRHALQVQCLTLSADEHSTRP